MPKAKLIWIGIGLVCVLAGFAILASGILPGLPDSHEKNVTVYYPPHTDGQGVSLYLQPPVGTLQVQGEDQLLAVQYTSHLATPVAVALPKLFDSEKPCFTLSPENSQPDPQTIEPGQSVVILLKLKANAGEDACVGEHAVVLHYTWKQNATPVTTLATTGKGFASKNSSSGDKGTSTMVDEELAVSTSPIQIVTKFKRFMERFFHAVALACGAVLIPVLLAMIGYSYQTAQSQRDESQKTEAITRETRQKEEALKFEVWKIIFPRLTETIEKYYVDLSRQMDLLRVETRKQIADVDFAGLFATLFTLRRKYDVFLTDKGGYSFRTKPAEVLCATLTNQFWDECYVFSGDKDKFHATVALFDPKATLNEAKAKLAVVKSNDSTVATMLAAFEATLKNGTHLKEFDRHLEMIVGILDFECDRPYYPEWYDVPPKIALQAFSTLDLGLVAGSAEIKALNGKIQEYRQDIPEKCRA